MDSWYFAYGSNLWKDQMIMRTGAIGQPEHPPRVARLADYQLVFQRLENGEPAFANILCPGDGVQGVVYRCTQEDLEKLDGFEQGYDRQPITVSDFQGNSLPAVAYVMKPSSTTNLGPPTAEYLERIIIGARQHRLPEGYIAGIAAAAQSRAKGRSR